MIVVDMQNDFVAEGAKLQSAQAHAMVPKLAATLRFCREKGIRVVHTAHVHRRDGSDMGLYDDLYSVVADRSVLVDGSPGAEIYKDLAPAPGEHVIKKHRYSAFFATDLDLILREWGVKTVIISGTTTENCCHATARDVERSRTSHRSASDGMIHQQHDHCADNCDDHAVDVDTGDTAGPKKRK